MSVNSTTTPEADTGSLQLSVSHPAAGTPDFLTPAQLAERLQVSIGTIRNWRGSGKLPFIETPGRAIRFYWPTVEQTLLRSQRGGVQ
jgi:excisionase family DNA binding protein